MERIAAPFRALGCPLRNAGALCSWLSREAPSAADPPDLTELHEIMTGGSWVPQMVLSHPLLGVMDQAEEPGLESAEFQDLVRRAADTLTDGEIRHWLRHGCGPGGKPDRLAMPFRPRSLAESLAELERRPRLAGIGRLVSRLEGVLSLPPRRLAVVRAARWGIRRHHDQGAPEQILPIQFALEGEEFLRRFAERELLYFHREEPRQPTTEEIILLLDQGVRTWGDVRLVLTGAAIALARQAQAAANRDQAGRHQQRRRGRRSGRSSSLGLSPRCWKRATCRRIRARPWLGCWIAPAAARRDIVLLTHPRSLADPNVAAAARSLAAEGGARLFAITVDAGGKLELVELRRGLPVVLARSRINLAEQGSPATTTSARPDGARPRTAWSGELRVDRLSVPHRRARSA